MASVQESLLLGDIHLSERRIRGLVANYIRSKPGLLTRLHRETTAAGRREDRTRVHSGSRLIPEVLGKELVALLAKINAAVKEVQTKVRSEYKQKLRESRGDKEARAKLQKEVNQKTTALLAKRVTAFLSDEQKAVVKKAAERAAKRSGKKKRKGGEAKAERKKREGKKRGGV